MKQKTFFEIDRSFDNVHENENLTWSRQYVTDLLYYINIRGGWARVDIIGFAINKVKLIGQMLDSTSDIEQKF